MSLEARTQSESTSATSSDTEHRPLLLCLSHLRWAGGYQRPQHLMSRLTRDYAVAFFEEPLLDDTQQSWLEQLPQPEGVTLLVPHLPNTLEPEAPARELRNLIDAWLHDQAPQELILWYFTPVSLSFTDHLWPSVSVFDCIEERAAQADDRELELLERADVVFTGSASLWEAKCRQHGNAHAIPGSSWDETCAEMTTQIERLR